MPPRNSSTKAFRKYHLSTSGNANPIPISKIYDHILKPEQCLDNEIFKEFNDYKSRMKNAGVDVQTQIKKIFKDDDDGDPRYINTSWYRNKLEGE